jgi:phosphoribosylanthranilate isomerase
MVWVKVCGVRTPADVRVVTEAGGDAIGLVMAPSSRRLTAEQALGLASVATGLETFLVTVDARPAELLDLAQYVGCTGVQPHGVHAAEAASAAIQSGFRVLRPRQVADSIDLSDIPDSQTPLLDTADGESHGGTGRTFDWNLAATVDRPFVLAGGLGPDNVGAAVLAIRPWGVDASSGLESAPGVKDHDLIRRYIQEAQRS